MADPRDGNLGYFNRAAAAVHRGRTDDRFSRGGENIDPKEVELLLVQHPAALVTLRPGRDADEAALKAFALERGPAYAHPRRIFPVDALPVGGTGKLVRKAVRERRLALIAGDPAP